MTFKGPQFIIIDGDMSGNITSPATIMQQLLIISYSIAWAGASPVGSISVEVSNDYSENTDGTTRNSGTWTALPLSGSANVSGNSDHGWIDVDISAANAIRLVYTRSSGTGLMQVYLMGK